MFNFNIDLKAKMIKALEKCPKARLICWGIITVIGLILFLKPVLMALIEKL